MRRNLSFLMLCALVLSVALPVWAEEAAVVEAKPAEVAQPCDTTGPAYGLEKYAGLEDLAPRVAEATKLNSQAAKLIAGGDTVKAEALLRQAIGMFPDFLDARYQLGTILRINGRLTESVFILESVVREAPEWRNAALQLALAYIGSEKIAQGLKLIPVIDRLAPAKGEDAKAYLWDISSALAKVNHVDEALALLTPQVRKTMDNLNMVTLYVSLLHRKGLYKEEAAFAAAALKAHPNNAALKIAQLKALVDLGETEKAKAIVAKLFAKDFLNEGVVYYAQSRMGKKDTDFMLLWSDRLNKALANPPKDDAKLLCFGKALLTAGLGKEAIAVLDGLSKKQGIDPVVFGEYALALAQDGQLTQAQKVLRDHQKDLPCFACYLVQLGALTAEKGKDLKAGAKLLEEAFAMKKNDAVLHRAVLSAYMDVPAMPMSAAVIAEIEKQNGNDVDMLMALAELFFVRKQIDKQARYLDLVLAKEPNFPGALYAYAQAQASLVLNGKLAKHVLSDRVAANKNDIPARFALAYIAYAQDNLAGATQQLEALKALAPNEPYVQMLLAQNYAKLGKQKQAEEMIESLMGLGLPEVTLAAAQIYAETDRKKAASLLENYLLTVDENQGSEARAMLAELTGTTKGLPQKTKFIIAGIAGLILLGAFFIALSAGPKPTGGDDHHA